MEAQFKDKLKLELQHGPDQKQNNEICEPNDDFYLKSIVYRGRKFIRLYACGGVDVSCRLFEFHQKLQR